MDSLKYIDYFNIRFTFYTNNQPNFQTIFGGIMTFLYILLCVIIFLACSYDDLIKSNPIITKNEIPYAKRKLVNLIKEKIWIPFRIVTYENEFIDHRGSLFIVPYFIEGKFKENIGMDLKYHLLNYSLCNETSMIDRPSNHLIDIPLNHLFCIDSEAISFGGNWNEKFLNYLEINLFLCEEGISYNSSDPRCKNLDKLLNNANSSLLFDFYFPIVQFQGKNLETPIQIIYKNYYYRLSSYSYKIEKLFLREHVLSDDKHMIRTHYKNSSCWGMSSLYADDYCLPSIYDPISNNSNTSRIFALNIYMDDGLVLYTRTFRKIFLIISNVFPVLKFVLYFLKKFTQHAKMSLVKRKLTGLIFENKKVKHKKLNYKKINELDKNFNLNKKKIALSNKSEVEIINNSFKNNLEHNNSIGLNNTKNVTIIKNTINEKKDNYIYFNYNILNNRINSSLNDDNQNKNTNEKEISLMNIKKKYDQLKQESSPKKRRINKNNNNEKYIFPYYYYFLDIFFDKVYKTKNIVCINKLYFTVYNFMGHIYDISTHILFYKQLNIINNIFKEKLSEGNELQPFLSFDKININDNKNIEKLNKKYKARKSMLYSNSLLQVY
jgi:hypothetical protein